MCRWNGPTILLFSNLDANAPIDQNSAGGNTLEGGLCAGRLRKAGGGPLTFNISESVGRSALGMALRGDESLRFLGDP